MHQRLLFSLILLMPWSFILLLMMDAEPVARRPGIPSGRGSRSLLGRLEPELRRVEAIEKLRIRCQGSRLQMVQDAPLTRGKIKEAKDFASGHARRVQPGPPAP